MIDDAFCGIALENARVWGFGKGIWSLRHPKWGFRGQESSLIRFCKLQNLILETAAALWSSGWGFGVTGGGKVGSSEGWSSLLVLTEGSFAVSSGRGSFRGEICSALFSPCLFCSSELVFVQALANLCEVQVLQCGAL